jgi:hypothetical protein
MVVFHSERNEKDMIISICKPATLIEVLSKEEFETLVASKEPPKEYSYPYTRIRVYSDINNDG